VDISLEDLKGSWVLLFFYPLDLGHISPSELLELERLRPSFERLGCRIVAVSRDSALVHEKFASLAASEGGVAGIRFPLAEDPTGTISQAYGMLMPDGRSITFRGCFIIDPSGIVKGSVLNSDMYIVQYAEVNRRQKYFFHSKYFNFSKSIVRKL
jgi:alkyl hydroperoxide reductase subunit AhpC